jgi:hypothetical protein
MPGCERRSFGTPGKVLLETGQFRQRYSRRQLRIEHSQSMHEQSSDTHLHNRGTPDLIVGVGMGRVDDTFSCQLEINNAQGNVSHYVSLRLI